MDKETAELAARMQDYGTIDNVNVNLIDEYLDDPDHFKDYIGATITKNFILSEILGVATEGGTIPVSAEAAYKQWADVQKCWRKLPGTQRVGGKVVRGVYQRVYTADEVKVKRRANMVNVEPGREDDFVDTVGIMRARSKVYGFKKEGDIFPIEGLTPKEVDALLKEGLIINPSGDFKAGPYKVMQLP